MPNLVMAVETGCVIRHDQICSLKVYRPVSYTAVLAVLEVPVKHKASESFHGYCAQRYIGTPGYVYDPDKLLPDCAALEVLLGDKWKPWYRPVEVITSVELFDT
jgi:hypothetical protein